MAGISLASGSIGGQQSLIFAARLGAAALCLSAAFVFDDPAAETLRHSPLPLLLRRGLRVAPVLPPLVASWALALWYGGEVRFPGVSVPVASLSLEFVGMLVITLCAAALAGRILGDDLGGSAAGPFLLLFIAVGAKLPQAWSLFPATAGSPQWAEAHDRWVLVTLLALGGLVLVCLEPAGRSFLPRIRQVRRSEGFQPLPYPRDFDEARGTTGHDGRVWARGGRLFGSRRYPIPRTRARGNRRPS